MERKIRELEAQLVHRHHFAVRTIDKAGIKSLTGSGVILSLVTLGGSEIIEPVCIRDGLSDIEITDRIATDGNNLLEAFYDVEKMKAYKEIEVIGYLVKATK